MASTTPSPEDTTTKDNNKMASSRLDKIWEDHIEQYRKIDDLEKRIDEHAMRLRRRVTNLLETAPSHRLSHLRLFVSHQERSPESERVVAAHRVAHTNNKKWTLTVEGKLLIGHLDHASAAAFDERLKRDFSKRHNVAANHSSMALATSENFSQTNPTEEEEPIKPIQFTHFFDKMVVQFQTLYSPYQPVGTSTTAAAVDEAQQDTTTPSKSAASTAKGSSSSKKKSRSAKRQKTAAAAEAEELAAQEQQNLTFSDPTEFVWNKAITTITNATPGDGRTPGKPAGITTTVTTKDAHAFMVHYDSPAPPAEGMKLYGAIATVQLYPSRGPEQRYKPSKDFAKSFFSKHHSDSDVAPPVLPTTSIALAKRADQENDTDTNTPSKKRGAGPTIPAHQQGPNALENEIHVPTSLTMDEILVALYTYITDRRLTGRDGAAAAGSVLEQDPPVMDDDPALIHNDAKLKALFQCDTMHFNDITSLLTRQKLILLLPKPAPIVVKYLLRPSPSSSKSENADGDNNNIEKSNSGTDEETEEALMAPMTMDLHNDVFVPNLFPYRARECLRRIKRRETDYTSSRTKGRYLLIASRAKDEATLKQKIEEAICGNTIGDWDVLTCLAKAAPPHSEARATAQLDAKIAYLLDEVEKSQQAAQDAWELVDWCREAAGDSSNDAEALSSTATTNDKVMRVKSEQEESGTNEERTTQAKDAMDVDPDPPVHDSKLEEEPETTI